MAQRDPLEELDRLRAQVEDLAVQLKQMGGQVVDVVRRSQDTETRQRIEQNTETRVESVAASAFVRVSPKVRVFSTTGTGGAVWGAATPVTLSPHVPTGRGLALVEVTMESDRGGGDNDDSDLEIEWRETGGTEWVRLARDFDFHSLVDGAEVKWSSQAWLTLNGAQAGDVRVFNALDDWTYALDLLGYL